MTDSQIDGKGGRQAPAVAVLGANGRVGRVLVGAFAGAGWRVYAQTRRPLTDGAGGRVTELRIAATETAALARAAHDAVVVVNAMNPLYTRWDTDALPLNAAAIALARQLDATLMLPGNVYNYGSPLPEQITESMPQRPTNPKGEIRCKMETAMRTPGLRSIVVRAGDFYGGPGTGTWIDKVVLKDIRSGRITYPGPLDRAHSWAYLPDLAQTFVRLAQCREQLAQHESFHFEGNTLTGADFVAAIARAARRAGVLSPDREPRIAGLPWPLLRMVGIVYPLMRELARMRYLWLEPHGLTSNRLQQIAGNIAQTPLDDALDRTLAELFPAAASAGQSAVA
jgi:nucleoside-diphosphate-sugar epimerase